MTQRRQILTVAAASMATLAIALWATPALAQTPGAYPNKPIKFVVPYPAGGFPDTVARIYAQKLGERLGQPVVIDNKPGANGVVAAQVIQSSPKDGYTFLVTDGSMFSVNPAIYKNLSYDYKRDFVPVSLGGRAALYLAVNPKLAVNNFQEFMALVKAKPGTINYGSSGVGSTHHLTTEAMKVALGLDMIHVPFRGTGQSVPALMGGQVDVLFSALPSINGFVKAGQLKLLISNAAQRSSQMPNVPTLSEQLIPGFDFAPIVGVLAGAGTPASAIERIAAEMALIAKMPDVVQTFTNAGIDPIGSSPAEYNKAILDENERLAKAIVTAGIKPE